VLLARQPLVSQTVSICHEDRPTRTPNSSHLGIPPEIRVSGERNTDGTIKLNHYYPSNNDWCSIGAALGMVNQQFDAWGAHFTVTAGGWTGHFFSGGKAGERYYGNASAYAAFAGIGVPLGPAGGTVSISAQGEGLSASTSVAVGGDPQRVADAAKQAEYSKSRMARDGASMARDVNESEAALKSMDWVNTQKPKDMSDYGAVASWAESMRSYIGRRAFLRERKEYNLPWLQNSCKDSVASANGDWRALIECAARLLELDRIRYEMETERISSLEAFNNTLAACSNVPAEAQLDRAQQTRQRWENNRPVWWPYRQ
jgi:hypothetical protein